MSRTMEAMSVKQERFIRNLMKQATSYNAMKQSQRDLLDAFKAGNPLDKSEASFLITGLLSCDQKPRPKVEAEPGYYVTDDNEYVVVVMNRDRTHTYAKRLEVTKIRGQRSKARWVYSPGLGYDVAHLKPVTVEEAARFGHLHGVCLICCRALTKPESVKNGIGPVCAEKI